MEKIGYKLKTVSSVIISPRDNMALYKELDFTEEQIKPYLGKDIKAEDIKVIYPFYRYGKYIFDSKVSPQYYLPGSSIKGALNTTKEAFSTTNLKIGCFMVDDILVSKEKIVLNNLYKAQYIKDLKDTKKSTKPKESTKPQYGKFFENVGIEMLKGETELHGEFYVEEKSQAEAILDKANKCTKVKMKLMLEYFNEVKKKYEDNKNLNDKLSESIILLEPLIKDSNIILLGGYKGLLHSMKIDKIEDKGEKNIEEIKEEFAMKIGKIEDKGAIFLDHESKLPYGLVKIQLV